MWRVEEASVRVVRCRIGALVLMMLSATTSAADGREPLPQPDPPDVWRRMTHDDATTTSRCLGDLSDPICVVETDIACLLRGDQTRKCRSILASGLKFSYREEGENQPFWTKYRILSSQWVVRKSQVIGRRENVLYRWRRGDLRVDVSVRDCFEYSDDCGDPLGMRWMYFLRRINFRWVILYAGWD
jgi:hypothetical protein